MTTVRKSPSLVSGLKNKIKYDAILQPGTKAVYDFLIKRTYDGPLGANLPVGTSFGNLVAGGSPATVQDVAMGAGIAPGGGLVFDGNNQRVAFGDECKLPANTQAAVWSFWMKPAGAYATGLILFTSNPAAGSTVSLGGTTVTFVASGASGNQVNIGANLAATLQNLKTFANASADANLALAIYDASTTTLTTKYKAPGTAGNAYSLATNVSGAAPSGPTLTGGVAGQAISSVQSAVVGGYGAGANAGAQMEIWTPGSFGNNTGVANYQAIADGSTGAAAFNVDAGEVAHVAVGLKRLSSTSIVVQRGKNGVLVSQTVVTDSDGLLLQPSGALQPGLGRIDAANSQVGWRGRIGRVVVEDLAASQRTFEEFMAAEFASNVGRFS